MIKNLTLSLTLLVSLFSLSSLSAQLPLYVNMGSTNTCGDFDRGIDITGDFAPGDHALVSGTSIGTYAPISHMTQPRPNACMYGSELFADGNSDLVLNYCDLAPFQQMTLTLHFEEIYAGIQGPGVRQFDINIQGVTVIQNFDIWAEADALNGGNGGHSIPVDKTFSVTADLNGCLEVVLADVGLNNPKINGISLEAANAFPVEFLSFEAVSPASDQVNLSWETASELNNAGFEVQYSSNGQDFVKAGFVAGVGTSQNIQAYEFSLTDLPIETYVFRLKQIDLDGSFDYSQSIELSLKDQAGISLGQVFPNPTASHASVELKIDRAQKLTAQVIDMQGRLLDIPFQGSVRANSVLNLEINLENQPAGIYLLRIKGANANLIQKIIRN